jgi:predicted O-methyltransferase YrrM
MILDKLFFRRPRILNVLHLLRLIGPTSQTIPSELDGLARHAKGKMRALEIGSYQGVSAAVIAEALDAKGNLHCIDPWPDTPHGSTSPEYLMFERHLRRLGLWERIVVLRGLSGEIAERIPEDLDFIFVDGDHSWAGIEADWKIVQQKLRPGGNVCFHDTIVPASEPWRTLESVRFFEEVIVRDPEFIVVERMHSMTVLERVGPLAD